MKSYLKASTVLSAMAATGFFLPALARADEIIVTATKIKQSTADIGASIAVVDGAALSATDGAEELSQYVAGLQAAVANGSQIAFQIRGIGAVDHQALTPTAAAVYVDGTFMATNVQTSPLLFDIERAEVLKGPQGSLYGRNATAGAINFISVEPGRETEGYLAGEFGNFGRVNVNAAYNAPVSDTLAVRLSGRYLSQDPLIDNVVTDNTVSAPDEAGGERDEFGLRLLAKFTPTDQTSALFNVHYAEDNGINASPRNEGLTQLGNHEISVGPDGIQNTDNEFYGASLRGEHDFGNAQITSQLSFEGFNQQYGFDFAALPGFFGGQTANLSYDRNLSQIASETRLNFQRDRLDAMAGIYLEAEDFDQDYRVWCGRLDLSTLVGSCNYIAAGRRVGAAPSPAGASASTLQSIITQTRKTGALFTYNQYALTPKLDLVFGGRLTLENIQGNGEGRHIFDDGSVGLNNQFANDANGNQIIVGPAIGGNEINETRFSGNLGLNYKPSDALLLYLSYANGFKSGGFNGEVINNASHFNDAGLFGPESVDSIEAGVKWAAGTARLELAGYYNFYSDPQARFFENVTLDDGTVIGLNSLSNFDKARSYGLDASAAIRPFAGFDLTAAITLIDTEIEDAAQPALNGNNLPFASGFSGTVTARYQTPLSASADLVLGANAKYQSEFNMDTSGAPAFVQEGYEVIDAQAEVHFDGGLHVGAWVRNATNSDYAVSAYSFFGATTFRGAPRQYGLSVRKTF